MKESKKQERKNLMEDMPIDSRAGIMMKSGGTFMSKHSSPIRMSADLEYMPIDDKASAKMYGSKKPAMYGGKKPAMYGGKKSAMYGKGEANKNGTININSKLDPEFVEEVLDHEEVHINQIRRGDLTYDDGNIYWKGRKFNKNSGIVMEGKNTPWEKQAYEESNTQHGSKKYNI